MNPKTAKGSDRIGVFDKKTVGITLLLIVNVLWVLSSELTRFIFVDEEFRRPFFTVYVKSCMLIVYMLRYLITESPNENAYKMLVTDVGSDTESYEMSCESLSHEGFESVTEVEDSDVESHNGDESDKKKKRSIRFSNRREVRRMPSSNADDQRIARLPYRHPSIECHFRWPRHLKYTIMFFAPMWLVCSFTYQAALMFTSVSSLNLISSSSSVFILAFSICFPSSSNRFTLYKAILVAVNIAGVLVVSHYVPSLLGAFFAQISALAYAIYLSAFSHFEEKYGKMSINLMFGTIGMIALIVGTPMLNILDKLGIESLHPLPNGTQFSSIIMSAVIGTLVADYLWLLAAGLCDSLTASLSLTISIPLSFLADTLIRGVPPTTSQLLAAIPIILAFVGAAFTQNSSGTQKRTTKFRGREKLDDSEQLIEEGDEDEG